MNRVNLELVYENKLLKVYEYKKKLRGTMNRHKTIVFEYFNSLYCSVFDGNKGRVIERQVKGEKKDEKRRFNNWNRNH